MAERKSYDGSARHKHPIALLYTPKCIMACEFVFTLIVFVTMDSATACLELSMFVAILTKIPFCFISCYTILGTDAPAKELQLNDKLHQIERLVNSFFP